MREPFHKVTAFVTRRRADGSQILLFRHPSAGVQLPAGSVDVGEEPEAAAAREAAEETGLCPVELVGPVGTLELDLGDRARILHADVRPSDRMQVVRRGISVRLDDVDGERALIRYEEREAGSSGARLRFTIAGWVPADVLGRRVVRHLVHLRFEGGSPDRWEISAEPEGLRFEPFWTPLEPRTALIHPKQAAWLAAAHAALLENEGVGRQRRREP